MYEYFLKYIFYISIEFWTLTIKKNNMVNSTAVPRFQHPVYQL